MDQFPRTLGQTQILGRDQVLTRGGESDQQDLTLGLAPSVTPQSDYLGISYPKSDYLTAVEYLQPQVVSNKTIIGVLGDIKMILIVTYISYDERDK